MTRVFDGGNAKGARVYDVDTKQQITHVLWVDADAGEVACAHDPVRLVGDEIDTYKVRFRSIYPIWGGSPTAVLFHCYGRQA